MPRLLLDPVVDATAKKAVSRQVREMDSQRDRLQEHVPELADDANDNTDRLASAVRQAITEAQESLATASTPTRAPTCTGRAATSPAATTTPAW